MSVRGMIVLLTFVALLVFAAFKKVDTQAFASNADVHHVH
jgi:hypothetical protein